MLELKNNHLILKDAISSLFRMQNLKVINENRVNLVINQMINRWKSNHIRD